MRDRIAVAALILVALLAAAPLWGPGMVNTRRGGDSPFLLQRTHQMVANLRAGVFPVRWMPDAAYGLGYPFFSYYAALPYYLAGLLVLLGVDILTALKLVQTLGFVAAGLAMYGWTRRVSHSRWAPWLAAVAYTVAPFHLVNVYVRGDSLSEFYAFVFYPLILRALDTARRPRIAAVALACAGLILTHNLSAFIFSPFLLLYLMVLAWREGGRRWRILGVGLLALGLGGLLSAWYWLPALAEMGQVYGLGSSIQDYFHYSNHFRTLNLVQGRLLFDYATADHGVRSPFAMGLVQAVFAAVGGLALIVRGLQRRLEARWWFVLLGLLISTAMITPLSKPLWDRLPLLPLVQFPWRFLSVQALFAATATAALVPKGRCELRVALPAAVVLIVSVLLPLHPERLPIGPADVTTERLRLYELFAGNIGTTIRYEWLPRAANPRPFTSDALVEPGASPRAIPLDGASLEATSGERKPTRWVWQVWGEGGEIAFPLLYWPGWEARVNDEPVAVWPVEGSGYLALEVPPGEHTVLLRLGRTPIRTIAEAVSLCTLVALIVVLLRSRPKIHWSSVIGHLSLAALPLLLLLLLPHNDFDSETDLTMDFLQMPYLHHNPEGVDFGGVARLAGYRLSADELSPGDTLTITLDWAEVEEGAYTATVRLVSPAAVRNDMEPLAETTVPLSPCLPISLSLPADIPRGVYLIQLNIQDATEYLRPVQVPCGPALPADASMLAPLGADVRLHAATIAQLDPNRLMVRLAWSAVRPVAANYGISLRLLDPDGQTRVAMDTQPGYGFLPTSMWRPGELVTDRYVFALPDDFPPGDSYRLQVILYQVPTLAPVGQVRLGDFALPLETPFEAQRPPRTFSLPPLQHPLEVNFGGEIRLAGYDLEREEKALHLTLWWQALQDPQADYTVFVHLFDPATETPIAQSDAMPQGGTYPTSWWAAGEVVSETVTLPLEGVPEGTYRLAVGFYDRALVRLRAVGPDGQRIPDDRPILPVEVEVAP